MEQLQQIQHKICEIRGQKVMLDFDLVAMYGIETRILKQAVKRNLKRFKGEDFMFELTKEELTRSQIVTLKKGRGSNHVSINQRRVSNLEITNCDIQFYKNGYKTHLPYAFTELGVVMLSGIFVSTNCRGIGNLEITVCDFK